MATLVSAYSFVEQARRIDPDGRQANMAEVLNRRMGNIMAEAPWLASNDVWTNKTTRRASLPTGTRRRLNQRITPSTSRSDEVNDVIMTLEDWFQPDAAMVDSMPSPAVFLSQESDAFIEGLGQTVVSDILYGDSNATPDAMHGVAPRSNTVDGRFVINEGGTGSDVTSIYVVTWDPTKCHLIYPKNMTANMGVLEEDEGKVTSETSSGNMQVYRSHYVIRVGLVVRDPRAIGRLANIETAGASNTFDEDNLIALTNNMNVGPGTRIYCNETILTQMEIRLKDKNNVNYSAEQGEGLAGQPMMKFRGIPIRRIDREILLNTETAIS